MVSSIYFAGTFDYAIDDRGRVPIPPRYRSAFNEGAVLRLGPEGCLQVYPSPQFREEMERLLQEQPGTRTAAALRSRRALAAEVQEVALDGQGRILIPQAFRQTAALDGQATIIGIVDLLEIWNPERWQAEAARIHDQQAHEAAQLSEAAS